MRNFVQLIDSQMLWVCAASLLATYLCWRGGVVMQLPTALISVAIVFPIVFSINAAYRRREQALGCYASLKAHVIALFYLHRGSGSLGKVRQLLLGILEEVRLTLGREQPRESDLQRVYQLCGQLSNQVECLREEGKSSAELSSAHEHICTIVLEYERMRNIQIYRTPTSLRAYSQLFLNGFPIVFAPYFAHLSLQYGLYWGLLVAALYSLILVSLDNIQELLENPYDGVGTDDVDLRVSESMYALLEVC